jgi:hypothetical protein
MDMNVSEEDLAQEQEEAEKVCEDSRAMCQRLNEGKE